MLAATAFQEYARSKPSRRERNFWRNVRRWTGIRWRHPTKGETVGSALRSHEILVARGTRAAVRRLMEQAPFCDGGGCQTMTRITRDDVTRAVGQADDVTIAKIIATGATAEELAEAQAWIANDEPLINAGKPLAKGRVGELVDILTELDASEEDEGQGRPTVAQE